jgi:hypothetical protein
MAKGTDRFDGWTAGGTTGTFYAEGASYPVAGNTTFYAKWTAQVTVTYSANGGTGAASPASQTVYAGESVSLASKGTLAKTGFNFDGWTVGSATYSEGASYPVMADTTVLAKWSVVVNAATPVITAKTANLTYGVSQPPTTALSVTATNSDGTTLSYQWYKNTTNSSTGGTAISGATTNTLAAANTVTTAAGKLYYYVTVTNIINDNGDGGTKTASQSAIVEVYVMTLKERIAAAANTTATITLYASESFAGVTSANISGSATKITLVSSGTWTVQLTGTNRRMFQIASSATLTLSNNVILSGITATQNSPVVQVDNTGSFTMNGGTIKNNTSSAGGGGVVVSAGGTFTLSGGTISGNTAQYGGGVLVSGGIFNMTNGTISGNTTSQYGGGGVCENTTTSAFTMSGGTISGNTSKIQGGGVTVENGSTFNKTGTAVIYGSDGGTNKNTTLDNYGHAVFLSLPRVRQTTLASGVNLSTSSTSNWD